jgi:hypothetical protein
MGVRKFRGSSSEDYDSSTGVCTIDFFYASKDEFRAVPEGKIALPWPFDRSRTSEEAREIAERIQDTCEGILREYGIALLNAMA